MGGKELKKAREAAGLTQEELGFKTKLHRTYISMLERDVNSLTLPTLFRICKVLNIRPSEMVARIEKSTT
jgi:transcriptional regulator with XRE-family HTH domain